MQPYSLHPIELDPETYRFYQRSLEVLNQKQMPFLVGGSFAFQRYTGISRYTKDLDLFIRASDRETILQLFAAAGYQTEVAVPHWLAKVHQGDDFIDLIFNSSAGHSEVDDSWFERAISDEMFSVPVRLCPPEEIIWLKSYVMARDRFDGADIVHLLCAYGERLDWSHLLKRFGTHWRILFSHLVLFGFIYPGERSKVPDWVMAQLTQQLQQESMNVGTSEKLCQGTLLAPLQYQIDVEQWGYQDARLYPQGNLTTTEVADWIDHLHQEKDEG